MKLTANFTQTLFLAFALLTNLAWAGAPLQKTPAPGFYRLTLGDFEITALSDGILSLNGHELLTNTTPARLDAALERAFLSEPLDFSVNAFLVNTGTKLVLIDTGAGPEMATTGKLLSNLQAAGYKPEQVDEICITHMHGDHIGGLTQNGKAVFPNAIVRTAQAEADYWLSEAKMNAAPESARDYFKSAIAALHPYVAAKHLRPFSGNTEIVPGIHAVPAPGHTPGHTVYLVSSKNENLLLWGDLMHVAAVQFPDPSVTIKFDSDSPVAARQRAQIFAEAAAKKWLVGGAHLSFPGLGHLAVNGPSSDGTGGTTKDGSANVSYRYVPIAYSLPH
jgi:glyoxylase-like metal-dependent hydrolase (beta-lactamase superfamily II)